MITGIFARADHPDGYGFGKTAHGYSVAFVECADEAELLRVRARLETEGLAEPMGHSWPWYGGRMDLVGIIREGYAVPVHTHWPHVTADRRISRGDNRFVGMFTAAEVLL